MNSFKSWTVRKNLLFCVILAALCVVLPVAENLCADESYSVQVALCENFDGAEALINLLKKEGYNPFFRKADMPGGKRLKRLCVGKYASTDQALKCGERLRMKGIIDHFIIVKADPVENAYGSKDDGNVNGAGALVVFEKGLPPTAALSKAEAVLHSAGESMPSPVSSAEKKLLEDALNDFKSGRYEDALSKFKKVKVVKNEAIQRLTADCHYFLGEKGDKQHTSEAIDRYRDVIRNHPDSVAENTRSSYMLARSYCLLDLNYEALLELKRIHTGYPKSEYAPKSLYMAGMILYTAEKFGEAAEMFKEYVKRFPEGDHAREACFKVGDCYSRMCQFNDADVWYDNALKKWPVPEDIPGDALLDMGFHYVKTGRYEDAIDVLFAYINLYPSGNRAGDALYAAARSFEGCGRPDLALKLSSLVIERYPESTEAKKSALVIADIGAGNVEMKPATQIFDGMSYYENPIEVYDAVAMEFSDPKMTEEIVFRKEIALIKRKRYEEAFDAGCLLIGKFPNGTHRKAAEENLMTAAKFLIDEHYENGDYLSVVNVYLNLGKDVPFKSDDFDMLSRIGESLRKTDLLDHAALLFENMIRIFGTGERGRGLLLEMAKIDYERGKYKEAGKRLQPLVEEEPLVEDGILDAARELIGDISREEGLYEDAANFYSAALGFAKDSDDNVALRKKYAEVLKEMGKYSSAFINYWRALKGCDGEKRDMITDLYEELGNCLYLKEKYRESMGMYRRSMDGVPEDGRNRWTVLNIHRICEKIEGESADGELPVPFAGEEGNEFWSKVLDYYGAGGKRAEEYGSYMRDL